MIELPLADRKNPETSVANGSPLVPRCSVTTLRNVKTVDTQCVHVFLFACMCVYKDSPLPPRCR